MMGRAEVCEALKLLEIVFSVLCKANNKESWTGTKERCYLLITHVHVCMGHFVWPWLMCRCLLGTYCNAGQRSPPHSIMLQRLFSMPNAGGSFKAVVSGLGHCVMGITLPSGILMSNLCCQTASSAFPPHIFLNLRLFCCFCPLKPIPSLSSLLPCTVNCCTLEYTPSNVASTTHTCKLSLSFSPLPG